MLKRVGNFLFKKNSVNNIFNVQDKFLKQLQHYMQK